MRGPTLAIETATPACSVALLADDGPVASRYEVVGRGHAERLVPMIAALLEESGVSRPDAVLVGCGPGSFTGVRVGIATAIGLGIGWRASVAGFSSTALIAAATFCEADADLCTVALPGGHGELFVERFARHPFSSLAPVVSLPPSAVSSPDELVAGPGADALVAVRGWGTAIDRLPDAVDAWRLPVGMLIPARPVYGRAPDAKPQAA